MLFLTRLYGENGVQTSYNRFVVVSTCFNAFLFKNKNQLIVVR